MATLLLVQGHVWAQDATWTGATSSDWNTGSNWSTVAVPTGTATFGASTQTSISFPFPSFFGINTLQFNVGAANYNFLVSDISFSINGAGIIGQSSNASFAVTGDNHFGASLNFNGAATAGNANITNNSNGGETNFFGTSTAGTATITNNGLRQGDAGTFFYNFASAGGATIINNSGGRTDFMNSSTAGNSTIINNDNSTGGGTFFRDTSSAGNATIITNSGGVTYFFNASTGGQAKFITNAGGSVDISLSSTGITAGSIEGAGNYFLGSHVLTVGSRNLSTEVGGMINDGGTYGGTGGSLVKVGTGTLTLSGSNTYRGGTTVSAGSLQLGNGGVTGSIVGDVRNNGIFAIDRSDTYTFGGVISGNGAFQQQGTGATILTGANSYAGATTISAGTLSVNGSIASSSLTTVNAGGVLTGTGTAGNTLIAGGTLAPGPIGGVGTLSISGSLTFQSAALYFVQVNPATASNANITGTATLTGGMVQVVLASGASARTYNILHAAGGLDGTTFAGLSAGMPGFNFGLSYTPTDVLLNLTASLGSGSNLNRNQQNVAGTINSYFNNGGTLPPGFVTVFGLTGSALANALTQLSGESATVAQRTTFNAMGQFMGLLTDPFMGRATSISGATMPTGYAEEGDARSYAARRRNDAFAMFTKASPVPFVQSWRVWAAGFGGSQTTGGNATLGSNDMRSSIFGTAVGADYLFSPNTLAGFALAGGGTNFSVNNFGGGKSDLFQAGAYLRHTNGAAYITGALAYGWQDITTNRTVTISGIDQLRAQFNANAWSGRIEGGYRFVSPWTGGIGITPYAAGQFTTFDLPAYAEQAKVGANAFALAHGPNSTTATRSELGLRSDKSFAVAGGIITLRGRAAWAHDFNTDRVVGATFLTLPGASFVVNGAEQAHDAALVTASAEMKWLNGWSAAATFEGEFSGVTTSYASKGAVRFSW